MSNPLLPCPDCKFLFCRCSPVERPYMRPNRSKKRKCPKCKSYKPLQKYNWGDPIPNENVWCLYCLEKHGVEVIDGEVQYDPEFTKPTIAEFDEWYKSLKTKIPCARCEVVYPHYITHWHHLDPKTKIGSVSDLKAQRNKRLILEEISKCILLCANCHIETSYHEHKAGKYKKSKPTET